MLSVAITLLLHAMPECGIFSAPGYDVPVCGVWYAPGETQSAVPLGGLGTGFVDFTSQGTFGAHTTRNSWLKPEPRAPKSGLVLEIGDKKLELLPEAVNSALPMRYWGHFPVADVDFKDTFPETELYLRALTPLVPHDYALSNMPLALFHFMVKNCADTDTQVTLALQWQADAPLETAALLGHGVRMDQPGGSYAVGTLGGEGWTVEHSAPDKDLIRSSVTRVAKPGETADVVFGLAWYFPGWTSSDGEALRHRYAAHYTDAGEVLAKGLPQAVQIEQRVRGWQSPIYASGVPVLLKDAVINGLYLLARNTWWLDDGRFFQSESFTGCPITETFVCRFNGSFPLARLWPDCERATMRAVAAAQADTGEIPFGFGSPLGSRSPMFHCQHPIVSSEFVLTTWRNYALWKDGAYLEEAYPTVQRALRYAMTLDKDGDGLVNEDPGSEKGWPANQYYDIWPWWGTSAYTGSIWLAALRAGEECAKKRGDAAFAKELRQWYERGAQAFEEKLWTGAYYRLYNDPAGNRCSETSLTNALCGQWFAYTCDLGEIVPKGHIDLVIDTVLKLNAAATPYGAVNGVGPDGKVDETFADHSAVITVGEVWNFCAMAAFAGRKDEAVQLFNESYHNILVRQRSPWNITWSLDRNNGALKWGWNYYSNTCVWTLLQALDPACCETLGRLTE